MLVSALHAQRVLPRRPQELPLPLLARCVGACLPPFLPLFLVCARVCVCVVRGEPRANVVGRWEGLCVHEYSLGPLGPVTYVPESQLPDLQTGLLTAAALGLQRGVMV